VVGKDNGLANVVVFIKRIRKGKKIGKRTVEIDNNGCRFVPHVSAFPVGTRLFVKNSDDTLHNAHTYLDGKTMFNLALPMKGMKVLKVMKKAGVAEFRCDAGHTWMRGWSYVTEHPYVTVTDGDGTFELSDVPPGRYKLVAWHEAEGTTETKAKIEVTEGGVTIVEMAY